MYRALRLYQSDMERNGAPYPLPDGAGFEEWHERELAPEDPGLGTIAFRAARDHMWYWLHREGEMAGRRIKLGDVLGLVNRCNWVWPVDTHLQAIRAAFAERETINAIISGTEDEFGAEDEEGRPNLELLATMLTLDGRLDALIDELRDCEPLGCSYK